MSTPKISLENTSSLDRKPLAKAIAFILFGSISAGFSVCIHAETASLPVSTTSGSSDVAETQVLPTITVTANQLGEITEYSGTYTPGKIATATRLLLKPKETPQSISVITRQEMDDFNLNSIDAVMRHTPGVNIVTYDSERTEYYSRGFAIQNFQYDGIPMHRDSAYSAGNTLSDIAIYDRVEVLKGATGLLTGVGDPGATINLIRKKPTAEFQGHAAMNLGSWDNYRGELDVSGALNEAATIRARGVAAYETKHSQMDRYQRDTPTFYGIVEADLSDQTLLTVGADYQDNNPTASTWGGIPIYNAKGEFNDMPRHFNNGANWSKWEQYTRTIFSTLEHRFENDWVAKLQLNHQINGYDAKLGAVAAGHPDPNTGAGASMWVGRYVGETKSDAADLYATGPFQLFGREHELVLGASISEQTWKNNGAGAEADYPTNISDYYHWNGQVAEPDWDRGNQWRNKETTKQNGVYATSRLNLSDDLKLILGGRAMQYKAANIKESGILVPYVGAVYDLNDQYSVYASYSSIFKPQAYQDENGHRLDPLSGKNYEAGLKGEFFAGLLNASLAYYQLEQDNFALERPKSAGAAASLEPVYDAVDGVKTKGLEFELSGQITPDWNLHAGFNHKVSKRQGEKIATLTPENELTLYSSYQPTQWVEGLTLGGGARWQDKTWGQVSDPLNPNTARRHEVASYWLLDAMANYKVNEQLSVSFNVDNLLDKKYYTIFNWYSTYNWGEGRRYNLGLKYSF